MSVAAATLSDGQPRLPGLGGAVGARWRLALALSSVVAAVTLLATLAEPSVSCGGIALTSAGIELPHIPLG